MCVKCKVKTIPLHTYVIRCLNVVFIEVLCKHTHLLLCLQKFAEFLALLKRGPFYCQHSVSSRASVNIVWWLSLIDGANFCLHITMPLKMSRFSRYLVFGFMPSIFSTFAKCKYTPTQFQFICIQNEQHFFFLVARSFFLLAFLLLLLETFPS